MNRPAVCKSLTGIRTGFCQSGFLNGCEKGRYKLPEESVRVGADRRKDGGARKDGMAHRGAPNLTIGYRTDMPI